VTVEPVPLTVRVAVLDAFDENETVPFMLPMACGVNEIDTGELLPGVNVIGNWYD
jgi:hypothetical protein